MRDLARVLAIVASAAASLAIASPANAILWPATSALPAAQLYFEDTTHLYGSTSQQACVQWDRCGNATVVADPATGFARIAGEIPAGDGTGDVYRFDVTIHGTEPHHDVGTYHRFEWESLP
jgi:hypothetical protein